MCFGKAGMGMVTFLTSTFIVFQYREDYKAVPLISDNGFVDRLREYWKQPARFLVFASDPNDVEENDYKAMRLKDSFELSGFELEEIRIVDRRNEIPLEELLAWADVLYLAGGHAPTQNAFMRECGLKEELAGFDGIVLGLSAGSLNAADEVYMVPELPGEAIDPEFRRTRVGLGLTDLNIVPHRDFFIDKRLDGLRFMEDILLPDSMERTIYLISDGSYFLIRDGRTEFYGRGEILEKETSRSLMQGEISESNQVVDRPTWETLLQHGYDCVLEISPEDQRIHFLHISLWMLDALSCQEPMGFFSEFIDIVSEKLVVSEEKEPFRDQAAFSVVRDEIRRKGSYVRTVHVNSEDGRKAKSVRVYQVSGDSDKLLCTIFDITSALDHDWMTDEYARSGFLENARKLVNKLPIEKGYALVYTNVSGFKAINDLFGTQSGDMVLFQVRDMLRDILDPIILGRFENDQFVLITREHNLTHENLKRLCNQTYVEGDKRYVFRIQCGIYRIQKREISINHMVDRARLAEKAIGNHFACPYSYYDENVRVNYVKQRVLMSDMQAALRDDEFKIFYQPVVETKTGRICGAEALIRWKHHDFGMVSPGEFIPVFEKEGMISRLDKFMVNHVMDFTQDRSMMRKHIVPCAVNLSRMDFFDSQLMNQILHRVGGSDSLQKDIKIEVTESAYAMLENNAMEFLSEMKRNGIQILLDDYGSGMSSLSTLESFAFDVVKLDMGFIRKIGVSKKAEAIIRSTIELSHAMGAKVTAEGVETIEQSRFLLDADCDMIQGYYYYRPVPESEFVLLLDDENR